MNNDTIRIQFSHLSDTVTCSARIIRVYSRLSDRKTIAICRLPLRIKQCTFTPKCINKEARTVRLSAPSYNHLMRSIELNTVVRL